MVESIGNFDAVIAEICFLKKKERENFFAASLIIKTAKTRKRTTTRIGAITVYNYKGRMHSQSYRAKR